MAVSHALIAMIRQRRGWQEYLAWGAFCLVPVYLAGLFARPLTQTQGAFFPRVLFLVVMFVTGVILVDSARRVQGRRRMTWLLQSIALWITLGSVSVLFLIY